jgi:hypothetical protein
MQVPGHGKLAIFTFFSNDSCGYLRDAFFIVPALKRNTPFRMHFSTSLVTNFPFFLISSGTLWQISTMKIVFIQIC